MTPELEARILVATRIRAGRIEDEAYELQRIIKMLSTADDFDGAAEKDLRAAVDCLKRATSVVEATLAHKAPNPIKENA